MNEQWNEYVVYRMQSFGLYFDLESSLNLRAAADTHWFKRLAADQGTEGFVVWWLTLLLIPGRSQKALFCLSAFLPTQDSSFR